MRSAGLAIAAAILGFSTTMASAQSVAPSQCGSVDFAGDCGAIETSGGQSAATESQVVSDAINRAIRTRFNSEQNLATQGANTSNTNTAYWLSAAGRKYSGDTDGWQNEGVGGVDFYLNEKTLGGVFVGTGNSSRKSINYPGDTVIRATVGGAYYAHQYADSAILHFYLGGGSAKYKVDGASVDATRYMGGVDLSWEIQHPRLVFVPYGKLVVAADDVPSWTGNISGLHQAATIVGTTLTAGGRFEFKEPLGNTGLMPYVSVGVDYLSVDPGSSLPKDTTFGPRLETGFSGPLGSGLLSVDVHAAKADSGTSDLGGAVTYSFGF